MSKNKMTTSERKLHLRNRFYTQRTPKDYKEKTRKAHSKTANRCPEYLIFTAYQMGKWIVKSLSDPFAVEGAAISWIGTVQEANRQKIGVRGWSPGDKWTEHSLSAYYYSNVHRWWKSKDRPVFKIPKKVSDKKRIRDYIIPRVEEYLDERRRIKTYDSVGTNFMEPNDLRPEGWSKSKPFTGENVKNYLTKGKGRKLDKKYRKRLSLKGSIELSHKREEGAEPVTLALEYHHPSVPKKITFYSREEIYSIVDGIVEHRIRETGLSPINVIDVVTSLNKMGAFYTGWKYKADFVWNTRRFFFFFVQSGGGRTPVSTSQLIYVNINGVQKNSIPKNTHLSDDRINPRTGVIAAGVLPPSTQQDFEYEVEEEPPIEEEEVIDESSSLPIKEEVLPIPVPAVAEVEDVPVRKVAYKKPEKEDEGFTLFEKSKGAVSMKVVHQDQDGTGILTIRCGGPLEDIVRKYFKWTEELGLE